MTDWAAPDGQGSAPYGIIVGTDGKIWFDESGKGNVVAFDPRTQKMEVVKIPTPGAIVRNMTVDSTRHRLWLAQSGTQRLGKIELK